MLVRYLSSGTSKPIYMHSSQWNELNLGQQWNELNLGQQWNELNLSQQWNELNLGQQWLKCMQL